MAASETVRAIGPAVSWLWAMGTMPLRDTRPSVGLIPTSEQADDGQTIEPSVSVPTPDRKSTRLNSSHSQISYAVFCLKKKNKHSITGHHWNLAVVPRVPVPFDLLFIDLPYCLPTRRSYHPFLGASLDV